MGITLKQILAGPQWAVIRNAWYGMAMRRIRGCTAFHAGEYWASSLRDELYAGGIHVNAWIQTCFFQNAEACPENSEPESDALPDMNWAGIWLDRVCNGIKPDPGIPGDVHDPQWNEPFLQEDFYALYRIVRTGWTRVIADFKCGCGGVENVAEHSFKTMALARAMAGKESHRLSLMALIHDHAELLIGDLTPGQFDNRRQKHEMEWQAYSGFIRVSSLEAEKQNEVLSLYRECLENRSEDAKIVHLADKLDMALQAYVYEVMLQVDLSEFFVSASEDMHRTLNQ